MLNYKIDQQLTIQSTGRVYIRRFQAIWDKFGAQKSKTPIYRAPHFTMLFSFPPFGTVNRGFTLFRVD
jgi:hypothetical protein